MCKVRLAAAIPFMKNRLYTVALIYLMMTTFLGWVFLRLENRYNPQHR